jgi:phosphonopyruvate decarboxylase
MYTHVYINLLTKKSTTVTFARSIQILEPHKFGESLLSHNISYIAGVPDSILKPWVNFLNLSPENHNFTHIKAVNECEAIALASGYNLSSNKVAMVYLQNSGLGKAVNPLTSLADPAVYSLPILLLIAWRGEPGTIDDPQHQKMGRIMLPMLEDLEIPYRILKNDGSNLQDALQDATKFMTANSSPFALICQNGFFSDYPDDSENQYNSDFSCEAVISKVLDHIDHQEILLSNTGKISRSLNHLRSKRGENQQDFYTLGSMGCVSSIGLGMASQTSKSVIVLDGDGSALMQLGTMASIGNQQPKNLYHIIIDNNGYCSTGCQPSISNTVNFEQIAIACSYKFSKTATTLEDFDHYLGEMLAQDGPALLLVKVQRSRRIFLNRLREPLTYKAKFQEYLQLE